MEAQMQEFKALAGEMSIILSGSHGEVLLQKAMMNKAKTVNRYLEFERSVKQLLTEIQQTREKVALKVIEIGEEQQKSFLEVQKIQEQWKNSQQQYVQKDAELKLLQQELEELERTEKEITKIEEEVAEDTTVVIPSTKYLAHIFHKVTKIIWDYDSDPSLVKGVHFGTGIAQPINIDSTKHSESFICDYLWNLLSTDW
ncbi:kinetochore protein Spc24 [Rhincodon typus]|uniref:kinetochore protein Spc24 n=1 Tax=Rhincodon typus TaxID=259920 RepID=UPI0009A29CC4|nr:kinetochore protein Spc24 [Rhincodon typus]XP_048474053.1 kinetochore protein Spc24 [Rhincodon typus]XP_048474054.1 kinetochore protein Spc24 [Rhincodon typus]XP_048474055.1 kinetochore protein Spc24 [Rhincodon typus]